MSAQMPAKKTFQGREVNVNKTWTDVVGAISATHAADLFAGHKIEEFAIIFAAMARSSAVAARTGSGEAEGRTAGAFVDSPTLIFDSPFCQMTGRAR